MFLTSHALGAADSQRARHWDWRDTTVLFLSYEWDPDRDGAEALAGRRLVDAMRDAGAMVRVLASTDAEPAGEDATVTLVRRVPAATSRIGRAMRMVRSTVPEVAGNWVPAAVEEGVRLLARLPSSTVIYGRAMPGASNVAAWHLARRSRLPWVAHFSDEWPSFGPLSRGRGWLAPYKWPLYQLWRRRIFRDAGALTFTNPLQAQDVLGRRRQYLDKAFVVAHLSSDAAPLPRPQQYDLFHIVHAGNVYYGRSAAALIGGLRLFLDRTPAARGRVRLTQAGWDAGDMPYWTERYQLREVVCFAGRLPQAAMSPLHARASVLVVVDFAAPVSTTMPSKLPDYIDARRPLLAVTAPGTALWRLFEEDGAGLVADYRSAAMVADGLGRVFEAWNARRPGDLLPHPAAVASFSRERVLAELAGAFATARRKRGVLAAASTSFELAREVRPR